MLELFRLFKAKPTCLGSIPASLSVLAKINAYKAYTYNEKTKPTGKELSGVVLTTVVGSFDDLTINALLEHFGFDTVGPMVTNCFNSGRGQIGIVYRQPRFV